MSELERSSIIIVVQGESIRFLISYYILKPQYVRCDWCRKSRLNFAVFGPGPFPVKFREKVVEISERIYEFGSRSNLWYRPTFDLASLSDYRLGITTTRRP